MYDAVFAVFNDSYVIRVPGVVPVKKDNVTWLRLNAPVFPLAALNEPVHAFDTGGKLGNTTGFDISALVRAPADVAGTPFYAASKSIQDQNGVPPTFPSWVNATSTI